ncbi:HupE/UreJ family protein [Granulosicoccus sp. 3-233]|uniref:HupE/UreJ family protein n=1 Tax=Granulosicoccus sp. 3-233 TaxID=3417969 RepID=UPI003D32B735
MKNLFALSALLLISLFSQTALAHEAGITDTGVVISSSSVMLTYTVPDTLLDTLPAASTAGSGGDKVDAILAGLDVRDGNISCVPVLVSRKMLDTIASAQFTFRFNCGRPITLLHLRYSLFFAQDSSHSNVLRISLLGRSRDETFSDQQREHTVDVKALVMQLADARQAAVTDDPTVNADTQAANRPFGTRFFPVGLEHILFGFDHVLFLVCLVLLPMTPLAILSLITSFTIAHSVTLSLSVLDIVTLPPRIVEAAIALSIVHISVRTIMILRQPNQLSLSRSQRRERLISTFLFGLIHGFGFSYLLKEIGLGDQALLSLLFFNLGVEAGQLIILAVLLPLIWLLGKRFPSWRWAIGSSAVTGLIGLFWLVERVANA